MSLTRRGSYINITSLVLHEGLTRDRIVELLTAASIHPTLMQYRDSYYRLAKVLRDNAFDVVLYEFREGDRLWIHLGVAEQIFEALELDYPGRYIEDHVIASCDAISNSLSTDNEAIARLAKLTAMHADLEDITEDRERPLPDDQAQTDGYIIQSAIDYEVMALSYAVLGQYDRF